MALFTPGGSNLLNSLKWVHSCTFKAPEYMLFAHLEPYLHWHCLHWDDTNTIVRIPKKLIGIAFLGLILLMQRSRKPQAKRAKLRLQWFILRPIGQTQTNERTHLYTCVYVPIYIYTYSCAYSVHIYIYIHISAYSTVHKNN